MIILNKQHRLYTNNVIASLHKYVDMSVSQKI